jgi:hypothetical chaperone protein
VIIGMDFGTTNSGLAQYGDDGQVRLLPVDPASADSPHVVRTALYLTREQQVYAGRAALDAYYEQNLGRPVHLVRKWVGEIEQTFSEIGTFIRDVYVWVDEYEPGRLFRSIKSHLAEASYTGTAVWTRYYTLEDLVALFMRETRRRAERALDAPLEQIVLGRPVRFVGARTPEDDARAERRLARAACLAGYTRVAFEYEPIAAAFTYALAIERPQTVLVFDFGGGTLDVTVMRLEPGGRTREVLATGGTGIGGDLFDRLLLRARVTRCLGEDVTYGPQNLPMPSYLYEDLMDWQSLLMLNAPKTIHMLNDILQQTRTKRPVRALLSLITNNYGPGLFDAVERAKVLLSSRERAVIHFEGEDLVIAEPVARAEFEAIIAEPVRGIERCVDETLAASGLRAEQIDAVVRTGGSSLVPRVQRLLAQRFGADKLRATDEFASVTAGLAVAGRALERGELAYRVYRPEDVGVTPGAAIGQAVVLQDERAG